MNRAAAFLTTLFLIGSDRLATAARKDRGATAVEYGLLVGLIAVVIIVAVGLLGGKLQGLFDTVQKNLPGGAPAAG
jgi:pilus assembly protein Flp/PilA